jgi:hypothetical protein
MSTLSPCDDVGRLRAQGSRKTFDHILDGFA